ncbi:MAG: hypothetical protein WBS19_03715, partial [Candidatus Korobacteraceae bacterium]
MKRNRSTMAGLLLPLLLCFANPVLAATPTATTADVTVSSDTQWVDTKIDVTAGDKLHITATGTVDFKDKTGVGPEGAQRGWADTLRALSVPSAGRGALVGQVGTDRAATPFLIGADGVYVVPASGRLYLGVNQDSTSKPTTGQFQVHIERTAASAAASNPNNYNFKPLYAALDAKLPYRVTDQAA